MDTTFCFDGSCSLSTRLVSVFSVSSLISSLWFNKIFEASLYLSLAKGVLENCLDALYSSLLSDDCFEVSSSESILSISESELALIRLITDLEMFDP